MTEILYLRPEYAPDYVPEPVAPVRAEESALELGKKRYVLMFRDAFEELTRYLANPAAPHEHRMFLLNALRQCGGSSPL